MVLHLVVVIVLVFTWEKPSKFSQMPGRNATASHPPFLHYSANKAAFVKMTFPVCLETEIDKTGF